MPPKRGKKSGRGSKTPPVDSLFVASHHGAARGDYLFDPADLGRKPGSMALTQSPPKRIQDQIYWITKTTNQNLTLSTSGAVSELPLVFTLGALPEISTFQQLFDQYCIYSVFTSARLEISNVPASSETSWGRIYSAVDFDSASNVGSENAIQEFSTVQGSELIFGKSYERFVKPCIPFVTGTTNGTSNTGVAMTRAWCNTATANIPHFGVRYLTVGNNTATAQNVSIIITFILGFRNSI